MGALQLNMRKMLHRYYLCIWAGMTGLPQQLPQALVDAVSDDDEDTVKIGDARQRRLKGKKKQETIRQRILNKKQQQRKRVSNMSS